MLARTHQGLGLVMFMDYTRSPVGPYRELLFIPATLAADMLSIRRIYVSSLQSVVGGRANWGIPKQLARFEVERRARGAERVRLFVAETLAVQLELVGRAWWLPFSARLLPRRLRTLKQVHAGATFITAPLAHGLLRPAAVRDAQVDPELFPAFTANDVIAAGELRRVALTFPAARRGAAPTPGPVTPDASL